METNQKTENISRNIASKELNLSKAIEPQAAQAEDKRQKPRT